VSLRLQLILLTTLVLLVSLIIGGLLAYGYAQGKVQTEMRAAIAVGGRLARNALDEAGASGDPELRLQQLVSEFDGDRHLRASWIDPTGHPVVSSQVASAPAIVPHWLYGLLAGRPRRVDLPLPSSLQGRGTIRIETDPHNEIAEAWDDVELTLATLGIFCGLVLLLTPLTLGYSLRPLQRLSAAFTRVGAGNYGQRIAERGPSELSRLCRGFNEMQERLSDLEARNRRLQEQFAAVQDEERADLARDLHDEVGPSLFAIGVDATMIKRLSEGGTQAEVAARSMAIREAVEHVQRHIRAMLGRLRPAVLIKVGLRQAVDNLITFWRTRWPEISFTALVGDEGIGEPLEEVIYRIVQESVSNAVRHGKPSRVAITVKRDAGDILVTVEDNGQGFDPAEQKPGHGLAGMEERVCAMSGVLTILPHDDAGVTVSARLPTKTEQPAQASARATVPA
jgi:two-component system sensor histidine kinase UhpB